MLSTQPWVGVWLSEATESQLSGWWTGAVLGTRFSASGIPDTAGHLRRAENKMKALGMAQTALGWKGGEVGGGTGWFSCG